MARMQARLSAMHVRSRMVTSDLLVPTHEIADGGISFHGLKLDQRSHVRPVELPDCRAPIKSIDFLDQLKMA